MASVKRFGKQVVFTSKNSMLLYETGKECSEPKVIKLPVFEKANDQHDAKNGNKTDKASEEKVEKVVKEATRENDGGVGTDRILACSFSWDGRYFVVCDDYKRLLLWRADQDWTLVCTRILARRGTSVTFSRDGTSVIVADKCGDVYCYGVDEVDKGQGQPLMGHLSMVLDVVTSWDGRYLMTCDRDEKVRVSSYPNCYNIHSFCLGHTQFVSQLAHFEKTDYLVSGSGDSTVRLWNYREGRELDVVECDKVLGIERSEDKACESELPEDSSSSRVDVKCLICHNRLKLIAVSFDRLPHVLVYQLSTEGNSSKLQLLSRLSFSQEVWDISLDDDGYLWVLQADSSQPVQLYHCMEESDGHILVNRVTEEDCGAAGFSVLKEVNKQWDFFKASVNVEGIFSVLHKPKIDNMPDYLKRKELRMAGKHAAPSGDGSEKQPEEKKVKTS